MLVPRNKIESPSDEFNKSSSSLILEGLCFTVKNLIILAFQYQALILSTPDLPRPISLLQAYKLGGTSPSHRELPHLETRL